MSVTSATVHTLRRILDSTGSAAVPVTVRPTSLPAASLRPEFEDKTDVEILGELLAHVNYLFGRVSRADELWHLEMFSNLTPHDAESEEAIRGLYRAWLRNVQPLVEHLDKHRYHLPIEGADDFLENVRAAEGVLEADAEFFSSEVLVKARDAAIDTHRRGETLEELQDA